MVYDTKVADIWRRYNVDFNFRAPVLSATVLGYFADSIGGVKDYSLVLEVQNRGAPHIHCVLWTNKSVEDLIAMNVVCCKILPRNAHEDPLLHSLVLKHQLHICNEV